MLHTTIRSITTAEHAKNILIYKLTGTGAVIVKLEVGLDDELTVFASLALLLNTLITAAEAAYIAVSITSIKLFGFVGII